MPSIKSCAAAIFVSTLAAGATASHADQVPSLEAYAGAGACGGSTDCFAVTDNTTSPADDTTVVSAHNANTMADGSYADASVTATFGAFHVYADAYRVDVSDAQSHATATSIDYIPATSIEGGVLNQSFIINGSVAPGGDEFGNTSQAYFQTFSYDETTGDLLDNTIWESTTAKPTAVIPISFVVPLGHAVQVTTELSAFAYSSFGVVDYVDYANTLHSYMTTGTPGFHVVGLSGHDYAPTGVPEPASWAVMLVGFSVVGGAMRRRGQFTTKPS